MTNKSYMNFLLLLLGLMLSGCIVEPFSRRPLNFGGLEKISSIEAEFKVQSTGKTKYTFSYEIRCFCYNSMDYTLTVENGTIVSAVKHEITDNSVSPPAKQEVALTDFSDLMTVEKYFALIREAYSTRANVSLDNESNPLVPSARIDWSPGWTDSESSYIVKSFNFD